MIASSNWGRILLAIAALTAANCASRDTTIRYQLPDDGPEGGGADGGTGTEGGAGDTGTRPFDVVAYDTTTLTPDVVTAVDGGRVCLAAEVCDNGRDDDCNGMADDGCACEPGTTQSCYPGDPREAGHGPCNLGTQRCEGSGEFGVWGVCEGAGHPESVVCGGGRDYLCHGIIDEGCPCTAGTTRPCYTGRTETRGVGTCHDGMQRCVAQGSTATWDICEGEVLPGANTCDGMDHLCNHMPMAGCECTPGAARSCYEGPAGTAGVGTCHAGSQTCVVNPTGGSRWGTCTGQVLPTGAVCDGMDHACNGMPYTACDCAPGATRSCYDGPPGTAGVGTCHGGTQTCALAGGLPMWGACEGEVVPSANTCDGTDRMCNGMPISGACSCRLGATQPCYDGPPGTAGVGECRVGMQTCEADPGGGGSVWGACVGEVVPQLNTCDGVDRLCDGMPLAGDCSCVIGAERPCYDGPTGTENVGSCHGGTQTCIPDATGTGSLWSRCSGEVLPAANRCDGVDASCSGNAYQGCACAPGDTRVCYDGAPATRHVGICRDGTQSCVIAGGVTAWGPCAGEQVPQAELCGNSRDDNCNNSVDEGCTVNITCPADVTVNAGTATSLVATASAGSRTITGYSWLITSGPTGGTGTPGQWAPSPPSAATEAFLAVVPGVYTIRVTATDSGGLTASCNTRVTAVNRGLRVQMTWSGSGDMDLHLHNGTTTSAWATADDCYFSNCRSTTTPIRSWDMAGTADDPALDVDNTSGFGPENIRIDTPNIGESYTIGALNFGSATGSTVTITVYCGAVSSATQTFVSTPITGGTSGTCGTTSFWKVASVVFTSGSSCTITPIDTYGPGADRCAAF